MNINSDDSLHVDSNLYEKIDERDNNETKIPEGECVRVPAIWVLEYYTPSQIENLHSGIESHNWNTDDNLIGSDIQSTLDKFRYRTSGVPFGSGSESNCF